MSGGSYEYLCWADDLDRLLEKQHHLEAMADRLAGLGYADDAAAETTDLLLTLAAIAAVNDRRPHAD